MGEPSATVIVIDDDPGVREASGDSCDLSALK